MLCLMPTANVRRWETWECLSHSPLEWHWLIPPSPGRVSLLPLPLQSIGSVYSGLMQGVGAAEKVFEFIDRQPTMVHDGSLAPDHVEGKVEFRNVTFSYRTRSATQVLQVSPMGTEHSQHHVLLLHPGQEQSPARGECQLPVRDG